MMQPVAQGLQDSALFNKFACYVNQTKKIGVRVLHLDR